MNIVEFSKRAGLSTATVSRAFHEPAKLRAVTRDRVLKLAHKLRYYPSASGRALVKGRHDVLGLVWPLEVEGSGALYAQRILAAITQQLTLNDLDLLICPVDRQNQMTVEHAIRTLRRSRCDAWIVLYPRHDDVLTEALQLSKKPVICFLGRMRMAPHWSSIQLNQHTWIEEALKRLKATGSRRVLFYGCRKNEQDHEERLAKFKDLAPVYFHNSWEVQSGWPPSKEEMNELLRLKKFDAVIGVADVAALTVLQSCRELGLKVPEQMQIIGIDNSPEGRSSSPSLATFEQPLDKMAAHAIALALGQRKGAQIFEPSFVPGESVRF